MTNQAVNVVNLPVNTESGDHLGRVLGVEVDNTGKHVRYYHVSSAMPLVKLWGDKLLISPEQVVSISHQEMKVLDNFSKDIGKAGKQTKLVPEPTV